ncbi:MAG: hypothetical protein Q4E36_05345 [Bacillota bacterium]|nr:hypothetical protein [Bacillota bacterium]
MYNSVLLRLGHRIGLRFSKLYKTSLIHKISSRIRKNFTSYKEYSLINKIFQSLRGVFQASFVYRISLKLLRIFDGLLGFLFTKKTRLTAGSEIANSLDLYSIDLRYGLRLFYESLVFLAIIFIPGRIFLGFPSFKLSGILLVLGLFGILISGKEFQIVKTSKFLEFFIDIFSLDQGGESWW